MKSTQTPVKAYELWLKGQAHDYHAVLQLLETIPPEISKHDKLLIKANCLINLGFIDEAILIYQDLQGALWLFSTKSLISQGLENAYAEQKKIIQCQTYQNTGLHYLAIEKARQLANAHNNKEALGLIASNYLSLNYYKTAESYFKKLIQLFPNDFKSCYLYCQFLIEAQKKDAYSVINNAIKQFPDSEAFHLLRADYFVKKNWIKCAMLASRDMLEKFPNSSNNYFNLIQFSLLLKKPRQAFSLFEQFKQRFPHNQVLIGKISELVLDFQITEEDKLSEELPKKNSLKTRPSFLKEMQVKNIRESVTNGYRLAPQEVKDYSDMLDRQTVTKALDLERRQFKR